MNTRDISQPGDGPDMPEPAQDETPVQDRGTSSEAGPGGEATIADLQRDRDAYYDRLLRKTAEFDNYRKRVDRERRELAEWAAADVLTDLLAIVDDFERALAAEAPDDGDTFRAGVELIHRQLLDLLKKRRVTPIEALGADFDPHVHQAVAYEDTPGAREGEVVGELRKGYRLGDRLLRPSMVKVAKAS